jgi:LysM repeat protein/sulfur relay (sulfurtransferase) DsrF/TusC family protein
MRRYRIPFFFIFFFSLIYGQSYAQESVVRSNVTQTIDGKEFYLHEVKNGETLYAISRAYHVNINRIRENNTGLTDQLEPGQIVRIPAFAPDAESAQINENSGYIIHKVRPKATLYGLSKEFGVSIEAIKAANGGLPDGLKKGSFIKIPKSTIATPEPEPVVNVQPQPQERKNYLEYQARGKESLYDIVLKYRVSIDSIRALNPGIEDQLKNEQIIKIPVSGKDLVRLTHTVTKRQTVNRLARKYHMSVDDIRKANPFISRNLVEGQVVFIPLPALNPSPVEETPYNDTVMPFAVTDSLSNRRMMCDRMHAGGHFKIALMIPFYLSGFDELQAGSDVPGKVDKPDYIKPFTFIQFYEGFMMAVDSLKKTGLNAEIFVYNVEDDAIATKELLRNPEMKQMDLIIGPVYSNSFKIVAGFAKENHIFIVNPFTSREEVLYNNPFVFKLTPSFNSELGHLVHYLNTAYKNAQIFIARHDPYRDETDFNLLRTYLDKRLDSRPAPFTDLYHEIVYSRDSVYTFLHTASSDHENVVITLSDNKVFILDFMRKLNELRDTFPITVIGIPEWKKIDFLEPEYLNNLNTQIMSDTYIDYGNPWVKRFVSGFRENYFTEPQDYAFRGYDIGWYFLTALNKFGPAFDECIPFYNKRLLQLTLEFEKTPSGGYENQHWYILQMRNYKFHDISVRMNGGGILRNGE